MAAAVYGRSLLHYARKGIHLEHDDIRLILVNGYTFNQDTHEFLSDVSASQVANGNGYTTGGKVLASKTLTYDATLNGFIFDAADLSWTAPTTITATGGIVVNYTGASDAARVLLAYIDFGGTKTSDGGAFDVAFDSTGIIANGAAVI
jgi:hypothetical protein